MKEEVTADAAPAPASSKARGPGRGRVVVLVAALLLSPFVAEGFLRFLLFSDTSVAKSLGSGLRDPGLFADANYQDEYWRLRYRLGAFESDVTRPPHYHPRLGWLSARIRRKALVHRDTERLDGRRPVLLYGASFADPGYQKLVNQSALGEEFGVLCYGVGGYGVDQVYLLLRESLDHHVDANPVVLIGLKADGDFARSNLSVRLWPKPRFQVDADGRLVLETSEIPPADEYYRDHAVGIRSYLWSHLIHGASILPAGLRRALSGAEEREARSRERIAAIVRAIDAELTSRGVPYGYLLFAGQETTLGDEGGLADEAEIQALLDAEGIAYTRIRTKLVAAAEEHGEAIPDYFLPPGHDSFNHPSDLGLERSLPSVLRAIQGEFDAP